MKKIAPYAAVLLLIIFAAFLRLYNMPDRPFVNDVWLWTIGFNLHKTPVLNIQSHVVENFIKSLIYSPCGWSDSLPSYLASGIYDFLKIPLSEYWIHFMHVFLLLVSIFLLFLAGKILFNTAAGIISAGLLAILPIDAITFGSSLYYHNAFLIFLQLIAVLGLIYYHRARNLFSAAFLSFAFFLNAGTENMILFPVFFMIQFAMGFTIRYFIIWLPALLVMLMHFYIYSRIGESNLGIIGYAVSKRYLIGGNLSGFLPLAARQFTLLYENFFKPYFIIMMISAIYFFITKKELRAKLGYLLLWLAYVFFINSYSGHGLDLIAFKYAYYVVPLLLIFGCFPLRRIPFTAFIIFISFIFVYYALSDTKEVLARKIYKSPLKSASFYVREHGGKDATIFQLIDSSSAYNYAGEYYFGRSYMEPGEETGVKRQLFCFGKHTIDEYKKAYNLEDFDFYIDYYDPLLKRENFLSYFRVNNIKKVADIERDGKIIVSIYSSHPLPYSRIDADAADRGWDHKYANLKNLLQNKWCGLAVLWGYHHRIK